MNERKYVRKIRSIFSGQTTEWQGRMEEILCGIQAEILIAERLLLQAVI